MLNFSIKMVNQRNFGNIKSSLKSEGWFLLKNAISKKFVNLAVEWIQNVCTIVEGKSTLEAEFEENSYSNKKEVRKIRRLFWNDIDFWEEFLEYSGIFNIARYLLIDPALIYHASFLKPKKIGTKIAFHQDQGLWGHDYPNSFNLWIALSDTNKQNGCLEIFPRSHLKGLIEHAIDPHYPWHKAITIENTKLENPLTIEMNKGDIILWDRYLVHGSGPNLSLNDRIGMVLVFADAFDSGFIAKDVYMIGKSFIKGERVIA